MSKVSVSCVCTSCNGGDMVWNGDFTKSEPTLYIHNCNFCYKKEYFTKCFPHLLESKYERVEAVG